jgi:hypothetical protein
MIATDPTRRMTSFLIPDITGHSIDKSDMPLEQAVTQPGPETDAVA